MPAAIVALPALPLTPSGKLDRAALPAPPAPSAAPTRPPSAREAILARLFADVLEIEHVPLGDSFFDLGGDSISSMELARRARAAGLALSPGDVFRHESVEALAALIAREDPPITRSTHHGH